MQLLRHQNVSQARCCGLLAALLGTAFVLVALYPYRWGPPAWLENQAESLDSGGVRFRQPGVAWTTDPPSWVAAARRTSRLEISLTVIPFSLEQVGPARILTLSEDQYHRNLTIAQEEAALVVRLRTPQTSANGVPPHVVPDFFSLRESRQFCVSIVPGRIEIASSGETLLAADLPAESLSVWDERYRLALGNEFTWDRPWLGVVEEAIVATGGTKVDCLQPRRLAFPARHWIGPNWNWLPREPKDTLFNFLMFVPLGYLIARSNKIRPSIWRAVAWCGGLSLFVESVQVLIPDRFTSTSDFVMNCCGAGVGGLIARRLGSPSD